MTLPFPILYLKLAGAALMVAVLFGAGWTVRGWRCTAQISAIQAQLDEAAARGREQAHTASTGFETDRAAIEQSAVETRTTIREIYRDIQVPTDCAVPDAVLDRLRAARDLANESATGEPSGTVSEGS